MISDVFIGTLNTDVLAEINPAPEQAPALFDFQLTPLSSHLIQVAVTVSPAITNVVRQQTIELFKNGIFEGFDPRNLPLDYIEETYKNAIQNKIKNYIFHHLVLDFLANKLLKEKIHAANYPRLHDIKIEPDNSIKYTFEISTADPIELKEWNLFSFKSPRRKKYKDLDKQVIMFIENYATAVKKIDFNTVEETDWVLFDAHMDSANKMPLSHHLASSFWLHVVKQEVVERFVSELAGKQVNAAFLTNNFNITNDKTFYENYDYPFLITIKAIVKGSYFSIDLFKSTFKLKNKVDIHNKLMEVFSYRNDISQRKSIIEEVFHLLLSKHRFEVPQHLVLRREEDILSMLYNQPDYHVYKAQKDFKDSITLLAEKQLKEEILVDQIAHQENLLVDTKDMQQYLHLLTNKRLKEFVYFKPILAHIDELDAPINVSLLSLTVLREKTLNHIIHVLTK